MPMNLSVVDNGRSTIHIVVAPGNGSLPFTRAGLQDALTPLR